MFFVFYFTRNHGLSSQLQIVSVPQCIKKLPPSSGGARILEQVGPTAGPKVVW